MLPTCQRYGMGVIAWSPLNGGWLTGRYRKDAPLPEGGRASRVPDRFTTSRPEVAAKLERIESLVELADKASVPLTHLALAFVLTHPAVTVGDHRPPHHGAADGRPRRSRRRARCRRVLDRIDDDRGAGHDRRPVRPGVDTAGDHRRLAAPAPRHPGRRR